MNANYNIKKDFLYFDIETVGVPDLVDTLEISAPSNFKDPGKIQEYIEKRQTELFEKAALDPDLGNIQAIAMKIGIHQPTKVFIVGDEETPTEEDLLKKFWDGMKFMDGRCCGFNILSFDIPFIMRRSMDLGVQATVLPNMVRYRTDTTLDLYAILYQWGPGKGLKWIAKRYGIANPLEDLNGSNWKDMDDTTKRIYACSDVDMCVELLRKMMPVYLPQLQALLG